MSETRLPADCVDDLRDTRLKRLLGFWYSRCAGESMPDKRKIDPVAFPYILGYVSLVDVEPVPRRYRFRLDGSILARLSGLDYTGKYLDQLDMPDYVAFIAASYDRVVDSARPYAYRKSGAFDLKTFDEETLILPFGQSGQVERLMIAVIPGALAPHRDNVVI